MAVSNSMSGSTLNVQRLEIRCVHDLAQRSLGKVEVVHGANDASKLAAGTIVF